MKYFLLLIIFSVGCSSPTSPSKNCETTKEFKYYQWILLPDGRYSLITIWVPKTTKCNGN